MRVYFDIGFDSRGLSRVITNLSRYLPAGWEVAGDEDSSDMNIIHVVGRHDHIARRCQRTLERGGQYAIIQYVLQSCRNPNPADWQEIWKGARAVWSYYALPTDNLYHAPLAADPTIFYKMDLSKRYMVGSSGNNFLNECIGEVHLATWQAGGRACHVGESFDHNPIVDYFTGVPDDDLRKIYNHCDRFATLRRKDGFEMPAIESMLCGVRPVLFDTPNYRQWYDGLADFIPEAGVGEVVGRLKHLFKQAPRPMTEAEIGEVKHRFDWQRSVEGFYQCLS